MHRLPASRRVRGDDDGDGTAECICLQRTVVPAGGFRAAPRPSGALHEREARDTEAMGVRGCGAYLLSVRMGGMDHCVVPTLGRARRHMRWLRWLRPRPVHSVLQ